MSRGLADSFLRYNHGEWIDCDGDPVEIELVVHAHWNGDCCSRCGELAEENYPRCPHCGAHMDEEVACE